MSNVSTISEEVKWNTERDVQIEDEVRLGILNAWASSRDVGMVDTQNKGATWEGNVLRTRPSL